jgi:cytochrome c-type biogenesis protein CcmH
MREFIQKKALISRKLLQVLLVGALAMGSMGAADNAVRYNELGHQMMCVCSCAQVLIECNHVGCPDSDSMLHMLRASLAKGDSDTTILEAFQSKYGPTVLAAPMLTRFNAIAWIVPPAVLALGLLGAVLLIRRWRLVHRDKAPIVAYTPQQNATRERIRRETEL